MEFHETVMGNHYYNKRIPHMMKTLDRVADALDSMNENRVKRGVSGYSHFSEVLANNISLGAIFSLVFEDNERLLVENIRDAFLELISEKYCPHCGKKHLYYSDYDCYDYYCFNCESYCTEKEINAFPFYISEITTRADSDNSEKTFVGVSDKKEEATKKAIEKINIAKLPEGHYTACEIVSVIDNPQTDDIFFDADELEFFVDPEGRKNITI